MILLRPDVKKKLFSFYREKLLTENMFVEVSNVKLVQERKSWDMASYFKILLQALAVETVLYFETTFITEN